jgi:hypothetical protein
MSQQLIIQLVCGTLVARQRCCMNPVAPVSPSELRIMIYRPRLGENGRGAVHPFGHDLPELRMEQRKEYVGENLFSAIKKNPLFFP